MAYEDRTYHGIQGVAGDEDESQPAQLLVEKPEDGLSRRTTFSGSGKIFVAGDHLGGAVGRSA
ncbi:hypothetical protein [Streptomyces sp. NPDC055036]